MLIKINPYPYKVKIEFTQPIGIYNPFSSYGNLDRDPEMERYGFGNSRGGNSYAVVYSSENRFLDQWNFKGQVNFQSTGNLIGDYDHDGYAEIACVSLDNMDIYLNVIEPFDSLNHTVRDLLIDTVGESELNPSIAVPDLRFYDLNGDGFDEVIFSLNAWYVDQPRKAYVCDIRNNRLLKTQTMGIGPVELLIKDYDRDGDPEIFPSSNASNNYDEGGIVYPDTAGYYFVLDKDLGFKVAPTVIAHVFSGIVPFFFMNGQDTTLWYIASDPNDSLVPVKFYSVNRDLSIHKEPFLPGMKGMPLGNVEAYQTDKLNILSDVSYKKLILLQGEGTPKTVPVDLRARIIPLHNPEAGLRACGFVTQSIGKRNLIDFWSSSGRKLTRIELETPIEQFEMDWIGPVDQGVRFLICSESIEYTCRIFRNPFYYLQFLILLLLIGGFYGFIYIIRAIQENQLATQENMRREILELQLKSVRNQLDPHFTFNALNTLSGLSLTGDQKGVDHFIGHFSRLLRTHLQTADKILVPLRDEIEFVSNYVELQRIRFDNLFELILEIPGSVDLSLQVPRLMIQTHVENAIKHGLAPGQEGRIAERQEGRRAGRQEGKIWVRIKEEGKDLIIQIEDNSHGRGRSGVKPFESTGKGLVNQERIFKSLWQLYGIRISSRILDLHRPDGSTGGTRVEIIMKEIS